MTVRIVSYNLLVPAYGNRPEYYFKCQPEHLQTDYRWKLIQSELEQEIAHHENTVLCFQEVSLVLLPTLELFFRRLNYSLFHNLYGTRHDDYMGVAMAIPLSMQLNSISIIKIGDHIRSMCKPHEKQKNLLTWGWDLYQSVTSRFVELPSDSWSTAMGRANVLIVLQVIIDSKPLWIGTYHMPCLFKDPEVMAIHALVVKDTMFNLAAGQDFILAGDFNIKPSDQGYPLLTGNNDVDFRLPSSSKYQISYRMDPAQKLKSAYREKNGMEPNYTNYADTERSSRFCATLDYVFFHGHLNVENVLELPEQPSGESYPDATHPSDHLMIAATFRRE